MLSVRSKLQLEVLLLVIEEESLDNLVLPKFKIGLSGFSTLGCWIAKEGCFYLDDEVSTVSFKVDLHRFVVDRNPVPCSSYLELLPPFFWRTFANLR